MMELKGVAVSGPEAASTTPRLNILSPGGIRSDPVSTNLFGPVGQPSVGVILPPSRSVLCVRPCLLGACWLRPCVATCDSTNDLSSQVACGGAGGAGTNSRVGASIVYVIAAGCLVAHFSSVPCRVARHGCRSPVFTAVKECRVGRIGGSRPARVLYRPSWAIRANWDRNYKLSRELRGRAEYIITYIVGL